MTHEEIVKCIIEHADAIAELHPFCLLAESDEYFMDKHGHIGNKNNIYEVDGCICSH